MILLHCHLQKHLKIVNYIILAFKALCKIQTNKPEKHQIIHNIAHEILIIYD